MTLSTSAAVRPPVIVGVAFLTLMAFQAPAEVEALPGAKGKPKFARILHYRDGTMTFLSDMGLRKVSVKAVGNAEFIVEELSVDGLKRYAGSKCLRECLDDSGRNALLGDSLITALSMWEGTIESRPAIPRTLTTKQAAKFLGRTNSCHFVDAVEFADDLVNPYDRRGPFQEGPYLAAVSLPEAARIRLAALRTGADRRMVEKFCRRNGGLKLDEYVVAGVHVGRQKLGVRIAFRPRAMPVSVFEDSNRRLDWLSDRKPLPLPSDVVMKVSPPFLTKEVGK